MASFARCSALGLADIYGETSVPIYCLNVTYPLVASEFEEFCEGKDHILVVEEGQPDHIEQNLCSILVQSQWHDKGIWQRCPAHGRRVHGQGVIERGHRIP